MSQTAEVMSNRQITIVTGPIDSGKTTWCRELAAANPGCAGLLLLKVYLQGERIGYDALRLPAGDPLPFARIGRQEPPDWIVAERRRQPAQRSSSSTRSDPSSWPAADCPPVCARCLPLP